MVKNPTNAGDTGDTGLIPRSGRSPGGGNGNPLQCSCLGNSMDRGAWQATVHRVAKESDMTEQLLIHTCRLLPGFLLWLLLMLMGILESGTQALTLQTGAQRGCPWPCCDKEAELRFKDSLCAAGACVCGSAK